MSKQDRQGVRTAAELERKYKFGSTLTEVTKMASSAKKSAEAAQSAADRANQAISGLDHKTIIDLLTNYSGVIVSEDGKLQIDLVNNEVRMATDMGKIVLSTLGATVYGLDASGAEQEYLRVCGNTLILGGKTVSWKDNGDGTYTLIGQ